MNCSVAATALIRAGVSLSPEQEFGDPMLVLFSALGAGAQQKVQVGVDVLDEIDDLLDRIQLRPGSYVLRVARENLVTMRSVQRSVA